MARQFTGRDKVLSAHRSYHGNTGAAIVATGDQRRWPNEYATGHIHFFGPFLYRSPFWSDSQAQECERALDHLRQTIIFEGPQTIAAILVESMVGSAGVIPLPSGYLSGVRALCDEHGIVMIADEVMVGFGRTGRMFAFEHDLTDENPPDLITFAKGVNSGYVPVGGVVIRREISDYFNDRFFPGGLTYSGHPLACATIVANLEILRDEALVENTAELAVPFEQKLRALADQHDVIGDVRGQGLFWALELVRDRATNEPLAPYGGTSPEMAALGRELTGNGLLTLIVGNRIHLAPPLIVSREQLGDAVAILDASLRSLTL